MKHLTFADLDTAFPTSATRSRMWVSQRNMLTFVADQSNNDAILESPTGSGKSAAEYAILKAAVTAGGKNLFWIAPSKTIADQLWREFPDTAIALGRHEHPCLYYEPKEGLEARVAGFYTDSNAIRADQVPCSFLQECPHRVNQTTGETFEPGACRCPYLDQKYKAKKSPIVISTMAFYLFTQLFSKEWEKPDMLVIDEAHRFADVVRNCLSYEITDYHIGRAIDLLEGIGATKEAGQLRAFLERMLTVIKKRVKKDSVLLQNEDLRQLLEMVSKIDSSAMTKEIKRAIKESNIDVAEQREVLKRVEVLVRDLHRYATSFEYSLANSDRNPLNYTYAFVKEEPGEKDKVRHKLVVKCYYVAPLIRRLLGHRTVSLSATIGDGRIFGNDSGIQAPMLSLESSFSHTNTAIFMPKDAADLSANNRERREPTKTIRRTARACRKFADKDIRSLVVTISNAERQKFLELAAEEGVKTISYGDGVTAKEAALRFKAGEGDVLVGTAANYAEGVDLPKQIAPVIFFLRPGFPNPTDPATQFEERRFGSARWGIWYWRMMQQALQVRGRNIRGRDDVGVTFFMSSQFKKFLFASLPKWLQPAYEGQSTFDQCVEHTFTLLAQTTPTPRPSAVQALTAV